MMPTSFDWNRFHAYRVFDEFLDRFVIQRKSYVTQHPDPLDLVAAFEDIRQRFVVTLDKSESSFEDKLAFQFKGASEQTKIVFANIEYLWAMPVRNLTPETKSSYGERWFSDSGLLVRGDRYFFGDPHVIANPGPWYLRNKYWELVALLRVLSLVVDSGLTDLSPIKRMIAKICHSAIYDGVAPDQRFSPSTFCGVHCAMMHLADPERYESIISASHRNRICTVFGHIVEEPSADVEVFLKQIRSALYDSYGNRDAPDYKYRWFFYSKDVLPLWIDKKSKKEQLVGSAVFDVRNEENLVDLEGDKVEISGFRIHRSAKLVKAAKIRDSHTCRACGFYFEDLIVHVHHRDPLSEYTRPKETKLEDLVTLCPTCHYLAHYWLRQSPLFKEVEPLLDKLRPDS